MQSLPMAFQGENHLHHTPHFIPVSLFKHDNHTGLPHQCCGIQNKAALLQSDLPGQITK